MKCKDCAAPMLQKHSQHGEYFVCLCGWKIDTAKVEAIIAQHFGADAAADEMSKEAKIAAKMVAEAVPRAITELDRYAKKYRVPTVHQEWLAMQHAVPGFGELTADDINAPKGADKTPAQNNRIDYFIKRTAKFSIGQPLPYNKRKREPGYKPDTSRVNPNEEES